MKLLITGAEGDIADALCRIARESWPDVAVHGADMRGDSWPTANGFRAVHVLPPAQSAGYLTALRELHARESFTAIVPVTEPELRCLAQHAPSSELPIIAQPPHLLTRFLDKMETARWLGEIGVAVPHSLPLSEATPDLLPLIVKPVRGHGSKGIEIVRSAERLALVQEERGDDAFAQQYLPDASAEFTCAIYRHRVTAELRTVAMRRTLIGGMTSRITVECVPAIDAALERIAIAADLDGSINVQLRLAEAVPTVFEINPRFSGTSMMRHQFGFQDFRWAVDAYLTGSRPPAFTAASGTRVLRLSRELLVPPSVRQ